MPVHDYHRIIPRMHFFYLRYYLMFYCLFFVLPHIARYDHIENDVLFFAGAHHPKVVDGKHFGNFLHYLFYVFLCFNHFFIVDIYGIHVYG